MMAPLHKEELDKCNDLVTAFGPYNRKITFQSFDLFAALIMTIFNRERKIVLKAVPLTVRCAFGLIGLNRYQPQSASPLSCISDNGCDSPESSTLRPSPVMGRLSLKRSYDHMQTNSPGSGSDSDGLGHLSSSLKKRLAITPSYPHSNRCMSADARIINVADDENDDPSSGQSDSMIESNSCDGFEVYDGTQAVLDADIDICNTHDDDDDGDDDNLQTVFSKSRMMPSISISVSAPVSPYMSQSPSTTPFSELVLEATVIEDETDVEQSDHAFFVLSRPYLASFLPASPVVVPVASGPAVEYLFCELFRKVRGVMKKSYISQSSTLDFSLSGGDAPIIGRLEK